MKDLASFGTVELARLAKIFTVAGMKAGMHTKF
jgi:hypothetical protein